MANIPTINEKVTGALLASAIGDALGWPNEFNSKNTTKNLKNGNIFQEWTRRSGGRYWSHNEKILPGEYSDDTQMILAVARSIIIGDWEMTLSRKELPYWLKYERGGGGALKSAAKLLNNGTIPWESKEYQKYFMAGGNGAAMRILPHVIAAVHKQDINSLIADVITDSIYTHGHPRAILGASCYAYALYYLMNKTTVLEYGELIESVLEGAKYWSAIDFNTLPAGWLDRAGNHSDFGYFKIWGKTVSSMIQKLEFIAESLNKGLLVNDFAVLKRLECFDKNSGAGDVAILAALYITSKYANNPALGIKTAAYSIGADTDTIASITGGLLGMLCGTSWIPTEWKLIQDYDCLTNIAEILISPKMVETSRFISNQHKLRHNDWQDSPIGKMRLISTSVLPSGKTGRAIINKMETTLGQTIYLKRLEKNENPVQSPPRSFVKEEEMVQLEIGQTMIKHTPFTIDAKEMQELINNPLLKRITFRKVLEIVNLMLAGQSDNMLIAKKLDVNNEIVEVIRKYI